MSETKDFNICDVIGHDDEWHNPQIALCYNCRQVNPRYYDAEI